MINKNIISKILFLICVLLFLQMILAEDATQIKNIVASQSNVSDQLLSPQQIAATAIENDFSPATINQNYFKRIDGLQIVVPK